MTQVLYREASKKENRKQQKWGVRIYSHPINYHFNIDT